MTDLIQHQAWADAEHWAAFTFFPAALADVVLFERLHHVHLTQSAWIWALGDRTAPFAFSQPGDFDPPHTLREFAIQNHAQLTVLAAGDLDRTVKIPWFSNLEITAREGLTQLAMHSHAHRGQNAARLRELGGEPPATDVIKWISKGRPEPRWASSEAR